MELVPMVPDSVKPVLKTSLDECPVCDLSMQKLATVLPLNEVQCCPRCTLPLRPIFDHIEKHVKEKNIQAVNHEHSRVFEAAEK